MLRILVVDDEPWQRRILSRIVSSHADVCEVDEAINGQQALEKHSERPYDIMFVDIRMPVMDGLGLIERVRELDGEKAQIAIISGYGEFAYAQKAIGLQVAEYLLKPIEADLVLQVLERMRAKIAEVQAREAWTESAREISATSLFRRYLSAPGDHEAARMVHSILPNARSAAVLCMEWSGDRDCDETCADSLRKALSRIAFFREPNANAGIAVLGVDSTTSERRLLHWIQQECAFHVDPETMLWIGVGTPQPKDPRGLNESFRQAQLALSMKFYYPDRRLFPYKEIASRWSSELSVYPSCDDKVFSGLYSDNEFCPKEIESWVTTLTGGRLVDPEVLLFAIRGTLLRQQHSLVERSLVECQAELPSTDGLDSCRSLDEACRWLCEHLNQTQTALRDALKRRHHHVLERCLERMEREFDPELSLPVAADWCHFSPSYFSKLFREHTGESFTDYMVSLRMSKAAVRLKNSRKKVYEIAEEVGYRDVKYFTRVFKRVYGVSPNEFRTLGPRTPHTRS